MKGSTHKEKYIYKTTSDNRPIDKKKKKRLRQHSENIYSKKNRE
jgi:hypothetical protein